jgi:hypothetical protein
MLGHIYKEKIPQATKLTDLNRNKNYYSAMNDTSSLLALLETLLVNEMEKNT